jgi:hypothetical protein
MPTIVKPMLAATLLLALGACSKLGVGGQDQMAWAKDALERNDRLEVVASDPQARTFTVRMKESGRLVVVPVDQVMAEPTGAPVGSDKQAAVSPASNQSAAPASPPRSPETSVPEAAPPPVAPGRTNAPSPGASQASGSPSVASGGEPAHPASGENTDSNEAQPVESTKGPHAESAARATAGAVLAEGPGYSIKASGPKSVAATASPAVGPRGAPERLHDPIICQGSRLLHIDNRNLEFDGDAITAEDGCEIHITNTHISAKGIGVLARAANVHIKNSEIDGDAGAVDASDGAQVYAQSSRFKGLTRRLESSSFHDLGGNVWN